MGVIIWSGASEDPEAGAGRRAGGRRGGVDALSQTSRDSAGAELPLAFGRGGGRRGGGDEGGGGDGTRGGELSP